MKKNKFIIPAISMMSILFSCSKNDKIEPIADFKSKVIGTWQSVASEKNATSWGFRKLTINQDTWKIEVTSYGDSLQTFPLFRLEYEGPYIFTEQSTVLPGSYNGTFSYTKKYLTLLGTDASIVTALGFTPCNLTVNVKTDVSESGCSFVESIEDCPADYDLISLENGFLIPGKRTPDMCEATGRPTERGFRMKKN